jgi:hypothetical protein
VKSLPVLLGFLIGMIAEAVFLTVLCYTSPEIKWSSALRLNLVCKWLPEKEYTYTRIVCSVPENKVSYCQDAVVSCRGSKVISLKLLGNPVWMNYTESELGWCEK